MEEEKSETQLKEAEDSDSDDNIKRGKQWVFCCFFFKHYFKRELKKLR